MQAKLIILIVSCLVATQLQAQDSWQRINQPRKARLFDVWSEDRLLIVGYSNVHSISADGGETWDDFSSFSTLSMAKLTSERSVLFSEWRSMNGYREVRLWSSQDFGKSFKVVHDSVYEIYCIKLCDATPNDWFYGLGATEGNYGVFISKRSREPRIGLDTAIVSIDIAGNVGMAMQALRNNIRISLDSGKTWTSHSSPARTSFDSRVRALANGDWLIAEGSKLFRSVDTGKSWVEEFNTQATINSIQFRDSLGLLSMENQDIMFMSSDYGHTWFATATAGVYDINYVWIANDSVAYANGSAVIRTKNLKARATAILHTERVIDLGDLQDGQVIEQTHKVYNLGFGDLNIASIAGSNESLEVTIGNSQIPTGDSSEIHIKFTATQLPDDRATIDLVTNTPSQTGQIVVKARVAKSDVKQSKAQTRVLFYPTSSSEGIISVVVSQDGIHRFQVRDELGREIKSFESYLTASKSHQLDIGDQLAGGLYFIVVSLNGNSWVEKILVQ